MVNRKKEQPSSSGLYLVATPIGNLGDISRRAVETLEKADLIVCEDTRVTGMLLKALAIRPSRLIAYNDHNAGRKRPEILSALAEGLTVALVSDAGMPLVSDPGFKLVRACIDEGFRITSVPGANAPLAALQLSGLPPDKFSFLGFLPPKRKARQEMLERWSAVPGTLIFFETASRLLDTLEDMHSVLGVREAAVVREITKLFEETRRGTIEELLAYYKSEGPPRGEIVIVAGPAAGRGCDADWQGELREALRSMSIRDAVALVAGNNRISRKEVYAMALEVTREHEQRQE